MNLNPARLPIPPYPQIILRLTLHYQYHSNGGKDAYFCFLLIIKQNHSHTLVRIYRRCISAHRLHRLSFPHRWVLLSRHNPWFVKAAPEKKKGGEQSAGLEPARGRTLLLGCIDTNASNHSASSANRPTDVHSLQAAITLHDYGHQWAIIKRC